MPRGRAENREAAGDLWAEFDALARRTVEPLSPRDRAILAVLFVAERRALDVKYARPIVVEAGVVGPVPSEPTISRHRERLATLLRALTPPDAGPRDDPATLLRAAVGLASYPAFCARLRRDYGLLLDPIHLQRALNPDHPHPASAAVAATVLRHLGLRRRRRTTVAPLTPEDAARRLAEDLAYEKRFPGDPGAVARRLWRVTIGLPVEVDRLAGAMRAHVRDVVARDPAAASRDAVALFADAWDATTTGAALTRPRPRVGSAPGLPGDALSWSALAPTAQCVIAALALLPGLAWTADDLAALVAPQDALSPELLVAGGWLAAEPIIQGAGGAAGATAYVCTPAARRVASVQPAVASLALESLPRVWRDLIVPRLQRECATSRQPYTTIGPVFEACGGASLVNECLDLAGRALDAIGPDSAITPDLRHAGEAARWMWRATSDLPVPYSPLIARLVRVADPLLDRLARGEPTFAADDAAPWAGIVAEHALIVAERVFMEADMGDADEGRRALTRLVGTLPDLDGGLLPPLDAILAHVGADRHCWLTTYLSALEYGILMTRDDIETLLAATPFSVGPARAAVGWLAALRGRLNVLERAESADEAVRGLDRDTRWNYPSLAQWDRGRIPATFPYWSSLALLAEARGTAVIDPGAADDLFDQAREASARATRLYSEDKARTGKWDRVVFALLQQGEVELAAGAPVVGATRMVEAATEAVRGTVEMATPRLAVTCQLAVAAALGRVLPVVHEVAARGQRLASLAAALESFAELCQSYPRADAPHWVRGADRIVTARGKRRRRGRSRSLAADLETWSATFMRVVEEVARVQEPDARRRTEAALERIAAGWDAADR